MNKKYTLAGMYKNNTILVAEDFECNYLLLCNFLKNTGAEIIWAKDGQQAVDIIRNESKINVVLMDICMPILDGYRALKKIRKFNMDIPIIAMTGLDKSKVLNADFNGYLSKPIKVSELFLMLSEKLGSTNWKEQRYFN